MLLQAQLENVNEERSGQNNNERSGSLRASKRFKSGSNQMKKESTYRVANASADIIDNKNNFSQKSQKNDINDSERQNGRSNQRNNDSQSKSFVNDTAKQLNSNY